MAAEKRQGPATPTHTTGGTLNISDEHIPFTQQMSARAREKMPAHLATPQVRKREFPVFTALILP